MKQIKEYLSTKNVSFTDGYYNIDNIDKDIAYCIIHQTAYGFVEFWTKKALTRYINDLKKKLKEEDDTGGEIQELIDTYEELLGINDIEVWHKLVGPYNMRGGDLKECFGIRYK